IPVIAGADSNRTDFAQWPWLGFFRSMMNISNGLFQNSVSPITSGNYTQQITDAIKSCQNVSILIIGTYTSFVNYSPVIKSKIDKVVIMGKPIGDPTLGTKPDGTTKYSFNCGYDLPACQSAMIQLKDMNATFVDIPRGTTPLYEPSLEMVNNLVDVGLPGVLKNALINSFNCTLLYSSDMPIVSGTICGSKSTWVPSNVADGPGGEMLLWDETASIYLLHPEIFSSVGWHVEPTLVNGSYEQTAINLRKIWTNDTNKAVQYK
ncbi:MAG: hypothetical protein RL154_1648, partial [Pseudomonadota bacterium]